ncbi:hypothetical protein ABT301_29550 [Streptomyces sp. NPDC000987]|uniref:hypothetical protein n=1 Tax=Streptomyces sp. NPDC000987 TaxID=3154374 RepID=UPI00332DEE58
MAGKCGQTYRIDPRVSPDPCNALTQGPAGLSAPRVDIVADPGLKVTAPGAGDCPQTWRVGVDASWAQTPPLTFQQQVTGADHAWERIADVPTIAVPRAGIWEVDYSARGAVGNAGTTEYLTAGIFTNGALIPGSETMVAGATGTNTGAQATGGMSFVHEFAAGDTVELWAYRIGQDGNAYILSNDDGRTSVMMHWLGPAGDTYA